MVPPPDARFDRLSPRHRDCLRLVYDRKRTKEIADILRLSPGTVSGYCNEAIRIVGARDRIDAAERFAAHERAAGPSESHPASEWVAPAAPAAAAVPTGSAAPRWRSLLPFRSEGSTGNELGIIARLAWIPGLALALAIGFGMLADAVRVVSDLVAGRAPG